MKTDIYSGIYYYLLLVNKEVIIPPCTYRYRIQYTSSVSIVFDGLTIP